MTRSPSPSSWTSTCRAAADVAFQVDPRVAERGARLGGAPARPPRPARRRTGGPQPPPAAAAGRFDQHRPADVGGQATAPAAAVATSPPGSTGNPAAAACARAASLSPASVELGRGRPDEDQPAARAGARQRGVLRQEAVARDGSRRARPRPRRAITASDVQVALRCRCRADANGPVGQPRRHRVQIRVGGRPARSRCRAAGRCGRPDGDLAPVGDQDPAQHRQLPGARRWTRMQRPAPCSSELAVGQADLATVPAVPGVDRVHELHRLDDARPRCRARRARRRRRTAAAPGWGAR